MNIINSLQSFFGSQVDNYALSVYESYYKRWRIAGLVFLALAFLVYASQPPADNSTFQDHIAKIHLDLNPSVNQSWVNQLDYAVDHPHVKGVLLFVDQSIMDSSDFAETESALHALYRAKKIKPIASFIYGYAHGNSYVLASATDQVVAQETASIGGISVISSKFDMSELMQALGVKVINKGFGDYKIEPEKTDPNYDKFIKHRQNIYKQMHQWMLDNIEHHRHLDSKQLQNIEDGQWYTGGRAKKIGLCDQVGDIEIAENWLRSHAMTNNQADLPVVDYSDPHAEAELGLGNIGWMATINGNIKKAIQRFIKEQLVAGLHAWQNDLIQKMKVI